MTDKEFIYQCKAYLSTMSPHIRERRQARMIEDLCERLLKADLKADEKINSPCFNNEEDGLIWYDLNEMLNDPAECQRLDKLAREKFGK